MYEPGLRFGEAGLRPMEEPGGTLNILMRSKQRGKYAEVLRTYLCSEIATTQKLSEADQDELSAFGLPKHIFCALPFFLVFTTPPPPPILLLLLPLSHNLIYPPL
jgi:hypothetical protein